MVTNAQRDAEKAGAADPAIQDAALTAQLLTIVEACKTNAAWRGIAQAANAKLAEINKVFTDAKQAEDDAAAKKVAAEEAAAAKTAKESARKAEDEAAKKAEQETAAAP